MFSVCTARIFDELVEELVAPSRTEPVKSVVNRLVQQSAISTR